MERATATAEEEEEEGEDDIVCLDESFFINDDYQLTTFTFGSQVLQLFCLQSASSQFFRFHLIFTLPLLVFHTNESV
ncbi:hypothetical protein CsSME_00042194 [Camellia sinensis var. sinensis]